MGIVSITANSCFLRDFRLQTHFCNHGCYYHFVHWSFPERWQLNFHI
jgi:hypothetical protein